MKNENNIKIAIEGTSLFGKSDGAGIYTNNLIENLGLIERKNLFYIYYPNAPLFLKSSLTIKQHNIKPKRSYFGLNIIRGLDVYHDTSMSFSSLSNERRPAKKLIATVHDTFSSPGASGLQQKISSDKLARLGAEFDEVITPSETLKQELVDHFKMPSSKISVIAPGIESFFCPVTTYQKSLAKARYSISGRYIIYSGKIEKKKNIARIIEAYSALKYESPPLMVFTGETGWLKDSITDIAKSFGVEKNIRHIGFVPRKLLPSLLGGALFMVRPSIYDGFAHPVLEAMACGCPVIASSATAAAEMCAGAGLLVDPLDNDKISGAMRRLIADDTLRADLEKKGLQRAAEFSGAKMARQTLELYRKVCEK